MTEEKIYQNAVGVYIKCDTEVDLIVFNLLYIHVTLPNGNEVDWPCDYTEAPPGGVTESVMVHLTLDAYVGEGEVEYPNELAQTGLYTLQPIAEEWQEGILVQRHPCEPGALEVLEMGTL